MEKTTGVVIKCVDYRETSQIVWFFTRDSGRLKVVAKGSRGRGGKAKSKIDLFHILDMVFYRSRNQKSDLHTLGDFSVTEIFSGLREDFGRMAAASYVAELVQNVSGIEDPCEKTYDLITEVLKAIAGGKYIWFILSVFEIKLLEFSGHLPDIKGVSAGCMQVVKRIVDGRAIDKLKVSPNQMNELRGRLRLIVDGLAGKRLKSLDFLEG